MAYISGSFCQSQCRWPANILECFSVFISIKNCSIYLQNANLLVHFNHKQSLKIFTGHTDNEICKTWGLEATSVPRCVKVQHIKGIANVLVDPVSRLRAVDLYLDIESKDHQQELSSPFELLPSVEQVTHMKKKIHQYVRSSHNCQIMKLQKPHFMNFHQDIAQTPQDDISIDLLGPYTITFQGKSYALTTVCSLTGYLMTSPIKDKKTTTVVMYLLWDIMLKFGFPKKLHSDNGTELISKLIEHLSQPLGIKRTYITPHHLQANG